MGNLRYNRFTILIYDSKVELTIKCLEYDSRLVIYGRGGFNKVATSVNHL